MAYQSCQQGSSPHTKIHTLTVHPQQTRILGQQGCTCTLRQAFIADLSTFIKDTKRENQSIQEGTWTGSNQMHDIQCFFQTSPN